MELKDYREQIDQVFRVAALVELANAQKIAGRDPDWQPPDGTKGTR